MVSFEEATEELASACREFLAQLAHGGPLDEMPPTLPPVAQRLWQQCRAILTDLESAEFEEIAP